MEMGGPERLARHDRFLQAARLPGRRRRFSPSSGKPEKQEPVNDPAVMIAKMVFGFALLFGGAEFMVRGAVALAKRLGVSALVIGMTVVAMGTSAPELIVSLNAALSGAEGLAVGNIVGSNIANILLILGVSALITPIAVRPEGLMREGILLLAGSLNFAGLAWRGTFDLFAGVVLSTLFVGFLFYSYLREKRGGQAADIHIREAE
ncbi:MAG TPA: sodium:calcium antiporter, partial [Alphaproteobacteria bacterium]|nr:sodium:calcium antiporter [Alphaproteobacteria bacterium]